MDEAPLTMLQQKVSGWGRFPQTWSPVLQPLDISEVQAFLRNRREKATPIGLRRSYADAALPHESVGIDLTRLRKIIHFDRHAGLISVEAGLSIGDLLRFIVPKGFFIPVTPGTRFVTLGGAVAHDVHGKNHQVSGSISRFVSALTLMRSDGEELRLTPGMPLFAATVAGLGLTGIITVVELQLLPIETAYIVQKRIKAPSLQSLMMAFEGDAASWPFSVAWVDCLAKGAALGRGHLILGRPALLDELPTSLRANPLRVHEDSPWKMPLDAPSVLLHPQPMRWFNKAFFHHQLSSIKEAVVHYHPFFYPLDTINGWNKLYGKRGFVQFQCVIPYQEAYFVLKKLISMGAESGRPSFLSVLKKMGTEDLGLLSFGTPGWTLTMDFPMGTETPRLMTKLEKVVSEAGGRLYLSKDAFLTAEMFRKMYPKTFEWQQIKANADPENRFTSELASRLALIP